MDKIVADKEYEKFLQNFSIIKRQLGKPRRRWEDNINVEYVGGINLAQVGSSGWLL
jgi:hypothetical protein